METWYYPTTPLPVPYWPDPYWAYQQYYQYGVPPATETDENNTTQINAEQEQQFANLYAAMLPYYGYEYGYYPYWYGYDPYAGTYESEVEGTTEAPSGDESTSTDPEIKEISKGIALQAIRSVSDIHRVYNHKDDEETETEDEANFSTPLPEEEIKVTEPEKLIVNEEKEQTDSESTSSEEESEDSSEEDDDDNHEKISNSDDHVPHQLSVIFEESDAGALSDITDRRREASVASEDDSSTTIAVESGDEEETVTVRLPLRFKFSRTENDEDVTTVIVGDSQVDKCNSISVTVSIPSPGSRPRSVASVDKSHEDDTSDDCSSSSSSSEEEEDDDDAVSVCVPPPAPTKPLPERPPSRTVTTETEEVERVSVKDRILAIERCQAPEKLGKSGENSEDEEADSGVTSQTDTESEGQEIRKNKYQRAATHSRLFKLLHDQCQDSDDEDENEAQYEECEADSLSREQLSLPLTVCSRSSVPDSFSSSGIASPASTPPRRGVRSAVQSELSTPGDSWPDYGSYYSSWDERSRAGGCGSPFLSARSSPFPLAPPRCPMTPVCAGQAMAATGGSSYIGGGVS